MSEVYSLAVDIERVQFITIYPASDIEIAAPLVPLFSHDSLARYGFAGTTE